MNARRTTDFYTYLAAYWVGTVLPRPFAYWVGLRVADRYYFNDTKGRQAVISNLRHILSQKDIQASEERLQNMARKTFQLFGKHLVDFFRFQRLSRGDVDRLVSLAHWEYVEEARAMGRGVLAVTAHLGSWEIGGAVLASLGCPTSAVILPERDRRTRALFRSRREGRGMKTIPIGNAARAILHALKKKEFVAVLADRDYSPRNDLVRFFGSPARLPRGPAQLCVKTGAPLLPGFLLRQKDDTFLLRFHKPIVPSAGALATDVQRELCDVLEMEIEKNPEQWFMFDDFWRDNGRR